MTKSFNKHVTLTFNYKKNDTKNFTNKLVLSGTKCWCCTAVVTGAAYSPHDDALIWIALSQAAAHRCLTWRKHLNGTKRDSMYQKKWKKLLQFEDTSVL